MSARAVVDVAIIGAGMAGLTAATALQARGYSVVVVDKGRGVGGRMATRRYEGFRLDHGAQYLTAEDPAFQQTVRRWKDQGIVREWFDRLPVFQDEPENDTPRPRYVGTEGMSGIAKAMAQGLSVYTSWKVTRLNQDCEGWSLWSEANQEVRSKALIVTSPLRQTLALFASSDLALDQAQDDQLSQVTYAPCWTLMVLAKRSGVHLPAVGGAKFPLPGEPLGWVADNTHKSLFLAGADPEVAALTIQAGPEWSQANVDRPAHQIWEALQPACSTFLEQEAVLSWQAHRWLYAFPINPIQSCQTMRLKGMSPCWLAGDAFGIRGKIETAELSGRATSEELLQWIPAGSSLVH